MSIDKEFELTYPQKSIWVTEQYFNGTNINNIFATLTIKRDVNLERLKKSINIFLKNNKSFGLNFKMKDGRLVQYFTEFEELDFEVFYLKDYDEVKKKAIELSKKPFDIFGKKLFDYKLFKLENGYGGVIGLAHHIISDAATFSLMPAEFVDNYSKLENNEEITYKDYSYEDYIIEEEQYKNSEKFLKDKEYWEKIYETIPEVATIPSMKNKTNTNTELSCEASREEYILEKEMLEKISEFCKKNKISNFNFFMAVYAIYLGRVSNLRDFVIGTPILNRTNFKEKHTTGMFINTAPLRIKIEDNIDFVSFAKQIAQSSLSMLRYQKYPYQMLLENLRKKDNTIPSLFDFMLSYQVTKANDRTSELPCEVEWLPTSSISDSMYVHLHDNNDTGTLHVDYDYQIDKYCKEDVQNMHNRILHIINQVLSKENCLEKDVEIVTEEEKNKILYEFNDTKTDYPKNKTVVDLFEEQVEKTPDNIAVCCGTEKLTYRELNEKANALAWYLKEQGVERREPIPVLLNRKINLIISIIAILKIGAIYLPIDVEAPEERVKYIVKNSNAKVLLMENRDEVSVENINRIDVNKIEIDKYSKENTNTPIEVNDTIYIIYTSGSTGEPKGVEISGQNLNNFIHSFTRKFGGIKQQDRCLSTTNVAFDVSIFETIITLLNGAQLFLYEENTIKDIFKYCKSIEENKITLLYIPPNILEEVYKILSKNKKTIINKLLIGVEPIKSSIIEKYYELNENMTIINAYGPTETTICATANILNKQAIRQYNIIPIGKPIDNVKTLVLDKSSKLVPIGIQGELYIQGECIGNGYLNNPEKNRKSFISNIEYFENEIAYKTGDIVKWNYDGTISYIGRKDNQVKINGHRIELGEIENSIYQYPNISKVVVIVDEKQKMYAYFTAKEKIDIEDLKSYLKNKLLSYFVPQFFMQIEKFKITSNGKIDKKWLLTNRIKKVKEMVFPKNEIESKLKQIFEKILAQENISTKDNFFELGGDSLSAIKLSTKIFDEFKIQIGIKHIFDNATIEQLAKLIEGVEKNNIQKENIPIAEEKEYYPLSSAQKRIYYNSKMIGEDNTVYNIPGAIIIDEKIDKEKVENIFKKIIKRHSVLRTSFILKDNNVVQKIESNYNIVIPVFESKESEMQNIINSFSKPFKLDKAPLIRVEMYYMDNKKTLLLFESHHIVMDGTALNNLIIEFNRLYNGETLKDIPIQYKDYAVWENKFNESEKIKKYQNYWTNKFKNSELTQINLPYDYKVPATRSYKGRRITKVLEEEQFKKIENFAKKYHMSPYMFFIATFFILLYKYTGQEEINIGSPITNRNMNETKRMIGMFVNNIVIKGNLNQEETFKEFAGKIKNQVLEDLSNQPYPYDLLVKELGITGDNLRNPLFDVMFTYQNNEENVIKLGNKESKIIEINPNISKFNLSLEVKPKVNTINIEYCTDLFKETTIERLFEHYMNTIYFIMNDINTKIKDISIISEKEKNRILYEFNDTKMDYPREKTITQLFEEQVEKTPDNVAVVFQDKKLTYKELNEKSNMLAKKIEDLGIKNGDVVGINMNRSPELIVAIVATLKVGAVYMPMYVGYPNERLEYMLENSKAKLLIYKQENVKTFNEIKLRLNNYNNLDDLENFKINEHINCDDVAYIIYTSGSTGKPKGVQVTHKNLINFVYAFKEYYNGEIDTRDNFLATTNISFDVSIWEIFLPLLSGATLVLYEEEIIQDIVKYANSIIKNEITALYIPPNILKEVYTLIKKEPNIKISKMLVGVEPIKKEVLNKYFYLNENLIIINGYGPTETTICCTALKYEKSTYNEFETVSIGHPLKNDNIYILSNDKNVQPVGIPGEIYVTGDGISKGYINRNDENEKNFLPNILDDKSKKMYKTGDIAKWNEYGEIEFIGRRDNQIKISGYRIELDEINKTVQKYPNIIKSYTITNELRGKKSIITYYTADKTILKKDIINYLKNKLPRYMVPSFIIQLQSFPLTENGKIDKSKLPGVTAEEVQYIKPRDKFEENVANIFKNIFSIDTVGIDDNFFELGGDSLIAIKFQIEALKNGLNLTYSDIFTNPTIRMLSDCKNQHEFDVDFEHDYEKINKILAKNTLNNINYNSGKNNKLGNVLLIGATGFIGIHVLEQLIVEGANKIYCLIRKKEMNNPLDRLRETLEFYFGNKYNNLMGNKIVVVNGDITDEILGQGNLKEYEGLSHEIDCVIDTAAIVKHYGDLKVFKETNIDGTQNVINFCKKFNKKLYYISTLSVSGNIVKENDNKRIEFKENDFFVGQNLNNIYVKTKFEAEKRIFEEFENGLNACVLRIGNITNRYSDCKFQKNVEDNAFISRIRAILNLGVIQEKYIPHFLEFTPVDYCAKAIVKVVKDNCQYTVLHIYNDNFIQIKKLLNTLQKLNRKVIPVSDMEFANKVQQALENEESKNNINGIIPDLNENKLLNLINSILPNSNFTKKYLELLDFKWPVIDEKYIKKYIEYYEKIKYI